MDVSVIKMVWEGTLEVSSITIMTLLLFEFSL